MENFTRRFCYWYICAARLANRVRSGFPSAQTIIQEKRLFCLVVGFIFFIFPFPVDAQTRGVTIEPAFSELVFNEEVREASSSIRLVNSTEQSITLRLYALDIKQTNDRGEIAFMDKPMQGSSFTLATFVELQRDLVQLPPNKPEEIRFAVRNSPDLSPGGHYAAIIAQLVSDDDRPVQQVLPALSSVLLIRKQGGERYHLSLVDQQKENKFFRFSFPKVLELTFLNEGNVHVTPRGVIEIKDVFGRLTHKGIINEGSFFVLPQVRRRIPVTIQQVFSTFPLMFYTINVHGRSEPGDVRYFQNYSFVYIDVIRLSAVFVLGALGSFGLLRMRYYYKKRRKQNNEK